MREPGLAAAPLLRRFNDIRALTIGASDGGIGTVDDVYFDDASWTVRYVVVDTGRWLPGRHVLLSPAVLRGFDGPGRQIKTHLRRSEVEASPSVDTARPVSRQHEIALQRHYGYDPHLRSARAVSGYGIRAVDGELGHVEDFLVDEQDWTIRYLIVDPRSWWPGAHVLVGTDWIRDVSWDARVVEVDVTRAAVRGAPRYEPAHGFGRDDEARLYARHARPGYWERRPEIWPQYRPAA
jgi:hypothetical protein